MLRSVVLAGVLAFPLLGRAEAPTFVKNIAPILYARCVSCHRPQQIGPMSLLTYAQVRPWAKAIRDEVSERRMPPWRADPAIGRFSNDPRLGAKEVAKIIAWVDGGAREGDRALTPKPPRFTEVWNIGAPDQELVMPRAFEVPEKGDLDLQYFVVDPAQKEDRYITAAEIRPGARDVVHHAAVYVIAPQGGTLPARPAYGAACDKPVPEPRSGAGARDYLFSWSPGSPPFVAPAGAGRWLPAGARLVFEVHYTTVGKKVSDRTRIGLRYSKVQVKARVDTVVAQNRDIVIPPGAPDYRAQACYRFAQPVTLLELKPHMHLRGRSMLFTLVLPDGKREPLLSVPDWSFDWQLAYRLANPRLIPAGARILIDARYDNSARNKVNPDPAQEVHWDDWWRAEMLAGMITFVVP